MFANAATVVEFIGDVPRTVSREIGKQIDDLPVVATAIDQSFNRIAPCPAAFATGNAQHPQSRTKIVERDGAVARHDDCVPARERKTTARPRFIIMDCAQSLTEQRHAVKDYYPRCPQQL